MKYILSVVSFLAFISISFSQGFPNELSLFSKALKLSTANSQKAKILIKKVISYDDPIIKSDALIVYAYLEKDSPHLKDILSQVDKSHITRGFVYQYYRLLAKIDKSIMVRKPCFFQDKTNILIENDQAIKNALKDGCFYFAYVLSKNSDSINAKKARFYHYLFTNDFKKAEKELIYLSTYDKNLNNVYAKYIYRYLFFKDEPKNVIEYSIYIPDGFYKYFYKGVAYFELGDKNRATKNFLKASKYDKTGRSYYWAYKSSKDEIYLKKASYYDDFYGTKAKLKLHKPIYANFLRCSRYKSDEKVLEFKRIMDFGFNSYLYSFYKNKKFNKNQMCEIFHISPKFYLIKNHHWNAYPIVFLRYIPQNTVSPNLVLSIIRMESFYNPIARTYWVFPIKKPTTVGLMQVKESTALFVAKTFGLTFNADMKNPKNSILYGSYYLKYLYHLQNDNLIKTIASYNAGPGNVSGYKTFTDPILFIEHIPNPVNRNYVKKVLNFYWHYKYGLER